MNRDPREFIFMDAGYTSNPKWFRVQRAMRDAMPNAMPDALLDAMREAMHMHHASIEYCFEHRTDGVFPVQAVKIMAQCRREEAVTALFTVGLWENLPGGMAQVHDYLRHQRSAAEMDAASAKGRKAAAARWGHASSNASSNARSNATSNAERRGEESTEKARKRAVSLPKDWTPTNAHTTLASELGLNLSWEATQFTDKARAKGWTYKDWDAAFRNYLRNSQKYQQRDGTLSAAAPSDEPAHPWASEDDVMW